LHDIFSFSVLEKNAKNAFNQSMAYFASLSKSFQKLIKNYGYKVFGKKFTTATKQPCLSLANCSRRCRSLSSLQSNTAEKANCFCVSSWVLLNWHLVS